MATQSTTPRMKIGTVMSPQSGTKEEILELMTAGISNILEDNTALADVMQYAGIGMWYRNAEQRRRLEASFFPYLTAGKSILALSRALKNQNNHRRRKKPRTIPKEAFIIPEVAIGTR